ncbi:deoxyribonuclease-1-like isoform X1 [Neolamprologus brichardi]|uniref:deoxyribonuclease-1-like isoform X1 n=1 Tax=Neolamprologus brichardi TaxID=32507 RepID=UPI0003EBC784|nr:deoxyribonuclease-1-like isoform X1 [Neolamprologus brichardi]
MRWRSSGLSLFLLLSIFVLKSATELRICAYNVQNFDSAKASNGRLMHFLKLVLTRCDISLLQHVVDPDGQAIQKLLSVLNRGSDRYEEYDYEAVASESLGNSPDDKQKYVFIYRVQTVNVTGQYQYRSQQSFVREPFVVRFQSRNASIGEFILVPLHSEPSKAVQEINKLYDVFVEVSKKWNNMNVMFLGDFHASCAYVKRSDRRNIRLFMKSEFSWLIRNREDTTVTDATSCAYDRIVVHGEPFLRAIKPFSAKVFDLGAEFKMSRSEVVQLSDHYPVEVVLKSSALFLQAMPLLSLISASVIVWSFLSAL